MDLMSFLIGLAAGLAAAFAVIRVININKSLSLKAQEKLMNENCEYLRAGIREKENEILKVTAEASAYRNEVRNLQEKLDKHKEEIERLYEKMNVEFKNLANEILDEKTKKFTQQNKENIDLILKPLSEKIKEFEKQVRDVYVEEAKQRFSLKEEVKKLAELNIKVEEEAKNLTRALKGESKTQGNWGEMILESILEKSGLVKNREYFVQVTAKDDEGKNQRPDVVVEYPGDRCVIIDSKVSLTAYERYCSAEDQVSKEAYLAEHMQSMKSHIVSLGKKNYHDLYDYKTLDFVMLFIPIEPAYLTAVSTDPELWNFAYEKRILMMSPTNLVAALKMISSLWRQEYQNRNAREIARQSSGLLDKFYGLLDDLIEIGSKLKSVQKSYDDSMNKLSNGKGNLIKRAKDIEALGARPGKKLPKLAYTQEAEDEETEKNGETVSD